MDDMVGTQATNIVTALIGVRKPAWPPAFPPIPLCVHSWDLGTRCPQQEGTPRWRPGGIHRPVPGRGPAAAGIPGPAWGLPQMWMVRRLGAGPDTARRQGQQRNRPELLEMDIKQTGDASWGWGVPSRSPLTHPRPGCLAAAQGLFQVGWKSGWMRHPWQAGALQ